MAMMASAICRCSVDGRFDIFARPGDKIGSARASLMRNRENFAPDPFTTAASRHCAKQEGGGFESIARKEVRLE